MDIPWEKLESARGAADPTDIPRYIDLVFSSCEEERKSGYWGIDNHAVVQGDLCTSAPYVALLIADRINSGEVVTAEVVEVLIQLFLGSSPETLEAGPLAGETLEVLCKRIVREAAVALVGRRKNLEYGTVEIVDELLGMLQINQ